MKTFKFLLLLVFLQLFDRGTYADEKCLIAHNNVILQLGNASALVSADQPIRAFDVHQMWNQLYWATDYYIYRTPLYDPRSLTVVAVTGQVGSLVVDSVQNHLYWSDVTRRRIEAAHLDGRRRRVVYETGLTLGALALDPELGKLFWIEYEQFDGGYKSMKCCHLDGSHLKTIFNSENIHEEGPLAIDVVYQSLYFYQTNGSLSEQWEINYEGIEPQIKLFQREEKPPKSLDLAENGFFYSNSDGLFKATWAKKMYTLVYGNNTQHFSVLDPYFKKINDDLKNATRIRIINDETQPRLQSPCRFAECQHDCLASSYGLKPYSCICRYGYEFDEDKRSCVELGHLYYSTSTTLGRLNLEGKSQMMLYNATLGNIQTFDVHLRSNTIYWSDLFAQTIYKAPIDRPARKEVLVSQVAAYGVAVDWLHGHLYWTDESRIVVASLDGTNNMTLIQDLDEPADIIVDPINRLIFWAECGGSLSLMRAGLDGSSVTSLAKHIGCGATLTADPSSRTLYWRVWAGSIYSCDYDGSSPTRFYSEQSSAFTILNGEMILVSLDQETRREATGTDPLFRKVVEFQSYDDKPALLKAIKSSLQPLEPYSCVEVDCSGLCLPSPEQTVPTCFCAGYNGDAGPCQPKSIDNGGGKGYLKVISVSPYSVTLRCSGPLLRHPVQTPLLHVTEVSSLVPRPPQIRTMWTVRVHNKSLPVTIDGLNPATTYSVSVQNRVTRASFSLTMHTAPPPLEVTRLPVVSLPEEVSLSWAQQGVHYFNPNPWQDLVHREFYVMLVSKKEHSQTDAVPLPKRILKEIKNEIKDYFVIIKHYKSEPEFDDDPSIRLDNVPWEEELRLAMVQVVEYETNLHLDIVHSNTFVLSDPKWKTLVDNIANQYGLYINV